MCLVTTVGCSIHYTVTFPYTVLIVLLTWSAIWYDRELSFPAEYESFYPFWVHITEHLIVLPVSFFNILYEPFYPSTRSKVVSTGVLAVVSYLYLYWICLIYAQSGRWVYGLMSLLGTRNILSLFYPAGLTAAVIFQYFAFYLNHAVHTNPIPHPTPSKKAQ